MMKGKPIFVKEEDVHPKTRSYPALIAELVKRNGEALEFNLDEHNVGSIRGAVCDYSKYRETKVAVVVNSEERKIWIVVKREKEKV